MASPLIGVLVWPDLGCGLYASGFGGMAAKSWWFCFELCSGVLASGVGDSNDFYHISNIVLHSFCNILGP
ncbi:hypothetical protein TSUD_24630 [Trifolium subterraneum]|uniref:Uncharacterized protein n=1 Tax=Trifolium subterraneum TaxID=3900 RepID=A0A2Z6P6A0_TRISU|nr:hypothetical protein TSUD_24630 [Trifolium subterraneum]